MGNVYTGGWARLQGVQVHGGFRLLSRLERVRSYGERNGIRAEGFSSSPSKMRVCAGFVGWFRRVSRGYEVKFLEKTMPRNSR